MDYPIFLSGRPTGTLSESRSGLYTVFEASLPSDPGHLVRLYLHGGGESAYLGLLQPWSGGLFLRRRLRQPRPRRISARRSARRALRPARRSPCRSTVLQPVG